MGSTQSTWGHLEPSFPTMKSIVFFAIIAAACAVPEPEAKADPKADPYLLYGGYGYYGYPYAYYGKRSAEAEPVAEADPKADPYLLYSGYYGYPYTYGYYGYPYATYIGK